MNKFLDDTATELHFRLTEEVEKRVRLWLEAAKGADFAALLEQTTKDRDRYKAALELIIEADDGCAPYVAKKALGLDPESES